MKIKQLLENVPVLNDCSSFEDIDVLGITFNTEQKMIDSLFFCLKGFNTDGHNFMEEAQNKGCNVCVVEKINSKLKINQILVEDTRKAFSLICANFYGNPAKKLKIIGITGTNGKTSSCLILKEIFDNAGHKATAIGTLGYFIGTQHFECNLTTPDPLKLHEIFAHLVSCNVEYVFMEVSAHAIFYEKIYGIEFLYGVLTNITQDHLDFFKTFENYKQTKLKFLKSKNIKMLVLNSDDPSIREFDEDMEFVTYGINNPSDSFAVNLDLKLGESEYTLNIMDNVFSVKTKLSGLFNVYNVLAVATVCILEGISVNVIQKTLKTINFINGRYNVISTKKGDIVLDFAHTPDGIENILKSVKQATFKDIICVFGCNGNRDRLKRPIMGRIAEEYCYKVFLTSDNPRFENAELIAKDTLVDVVNREKFKVEIDRKKAIFEAISLLDENSVVVICGKGGEKYQDINGINVPYEDIAVINGVVEKLKIKKV